MPGKHKVRHSKAPMASPAEQLTDLHRLSSSARDWVDEVRRLTTPDRVYWCDGSDAEYRALIADLEGRKELLPLNAKSFPAATSPARTPQT